SGAARIYDARGDADLRVRVRGVRGPLRGAARRSRRRRLPRLRLRPHPAPLLDRLAARAPAARRRRALRRIAPRRARTRPPGPDRNRAPEAGPGGKPEMSDATAERRERLVELFREVESCTRCPLHETRTKAVFGAGNADADLMFVGEAPGAEEDRQGLPFVG